MTPENFVYWLQGFSELQDTAPSDVQWKIIQEHIALALKKVTPPSQIRFGPGLSPTPPIAPGPLEQYLKPEPPAAPPGRSVITC